MPLQVTSQEAKLGVLASLEGANKLPKVAVPLANNLVSTSLTVDALSIVSKPTILNRATMAKVTAN